MSIISNPLEAAQHRATAERLTKLEKQLAEVRAEIERLGKRLAELVEYEQETLGCCECRFDNGKRLEQCSHHAAIEAERDEGMAIIIDLLSQVEQGNDVYEVLANYRAIHRNARKALSNLPARAKAMAELVEAALLAADNERASAFRPDCLVNLIRKADAYRDSIEGKKDSS
jgi:hypothetical protein